MSTNGSHDDPPFEKPVPREPRSSADCERVQALNRRREYLNRHPSYFDSMEHELADPILYERLIKRYQTPAQREKDGKAKGYGRTLEADLIRGETRLADVDPSRRDPASAVDADRGDASSRGYVAGGTGVENEWDQDAASAEQGKELWREFLTDRFVRGGDDDFDYGAVDANEELDEMARQDMQDAWFDEEEPSWHGGEPRADGERPGDAKTTQGETGVQDF